MRPRPLLTELGTQEDAKGKFTQLFSGWACSRRRELGATLITGEKNENVPHPWQDSASRAKEVRNRAEAGPTLRSWGRDWVKRKAGKGASNLTVTGPEAQN